MIILDARESNTEEDLSFKFPTTCIYLRISVYLSSIQQLSTEKKKKKKKKKEEEEEEEEKKKT
jgi:hypothetical protein